jgi:cytidyltransferase-like protein
MIIGVKSGTFTILTKGHIECLKFCKKYCDYLIVVINDDEYITNKKGFCAVPAEERREVLLGLKYVDEVIIYAGPHEQGVLKHLREKYVDDLLTVFHSIETHDKEFIPGDKIADRLIFVPDVKSSSTSDIIHKIYRGVTHANRN